jgi:hypothetical protein
MRSTRSIPASPKPPACRAGLHPETKTSCPPYPWRKSLGAERSQRVSARTPSGAKRSPRLGPSLPLRSERRRWSGCWLKLGLRLGLAEALAIALRGYADVFAKYAHQV